MKIRLEKQTEIMINKKKIDKIDKVYYYKKSNNNIYVKNSYQK